jgi:8-oxo-dGTP pyrophosphatase MutT (NUDIX family)
LGPGPSAVAGTDAAVPRPAATVALVRDAGTGRGDRGGVDVWLMRRQPTMAFAPGAHVFPGGAVDPPDREDAVRLDRQRIAHVADAFGIDDANAAALVNAAVRETFEECGVLLVDPPVAWEHDLAGVQGETRRIALLTGALTWPQLLAEDATAAAVDALVPWARWITPEWSPKRFDAYFFVTTVPRDQEPRWLGGEADRSSWFGARAAVAAFEAGDLPMLPPTIALLRDLAAHDTVDDVLAADPGRIGVMSG